MVIIQGAGGDRAESEKSEAVCTMLCYPVGIGATDRADVRFARLADSTSIRLTEFPEASTLNL